MLHKVLILISFLLSPIIAFSGLGHETGNGGSRVGNEVADVYYVRKVNELPTGLTSFELDDIPGLKNEYQRLRTFINAKGLNTHFKLNENKNVKFYYTDKLSGRDPLDVEPDKKSVPVSYSYLFEKYSNDYSELHKEHVIEVLKDDFLRMNLHNQALVILHEMLHIKYPDKGHNLISPFIKMLKINYELHKKQENGIIEEVTEKEGEASLKFFKLLITLHREDGLAMKNVKLKDYNYSLLGGGLVSFDQGQFPTKLVSIGIDSSIHVLVKFLLDETNPSLDLDEIIVPKEILEKHFHGNSFSKTLSWITLHSRATGDGTVYSMSDCLNNHFTNLNNGYFDVNTNNITCRGSNNTIKNFIPTKYWNGHYNHNNGLKFSIDLNGSNNTIDHFAGSFKLGSNNIIVKSFLFAGRLGNHSFIENSYLHRPDIGSYNGIRNSYLSNVNLSEITGLTVENSFLEDTLVKSGIDTNSTFNRIQLKDTIIDMNKTRPQHLTGLRISSKYVNTKIKLFVSTNTTKLLFDSNFHYKYARYQSKGIELDSSPKVFINNLTGFKKIREPFPEH